MPLDEGGLDMAIEGDCTGGAGGDGRGSGVSVYSDWAITAVLISIIHSKRCTMGTSYEGKPKKGTNQPVILIMSHRFYCFL